MVRRLVPRHPVAPRPLVRRHADRGVLGGSRARPSSLVHGTTADHRTWRVLGPMLARRHAAPRHRPAGSRRLRRRRRPRTRSGSSWTTSPRWPRRSRRRPAARSTSLGHSLGGRIALGAIAADAVDPARHRVRERARVHAARAGRTRRAPRGAPRGPRPRRQRRAPRPVHDRGGRDAAGRPRGVPGRPDLAAALRGSTDDRARARCSRRRAGGVDGRARGGQRPGAPGRRVRVAGLVPRGGRGARRAARATAGSRSSRRPARGPPQPSRRGWSPSSRRSSPAESSRAVTVRAVGLPSCA